jgi:hypothetical protein
MISPVIHKMLENKIGKHIRYPSDCEALAIDIALETKQAIGVSTLKRMFGFVSDRCEPRTSTLDIIALYLGFNSYNELIINNAENINSIFSSISIISSHELKLGDKVIFCYSPNRKVSLVYLDNSLFRVEECLNSKLKINDVLEINQFILNYPLFVKSVQRDNENIGSYCAGRSSGLTTLKVTR